MEGKVCDSIGTPIPNASLQLLAENSGSAPDSPIGATSTTDAEGKYALKAPGAGRYTLRVAASGFATFVAKDLALNGVDRRHMDIVLRLAPSGRPAVVLPTPREHGLQDPAPQFSDTPNFTVAGIADRSNLGLHGSDANVRTSDSLAKQTAGLKASVPEKSSELSRAADSHRASGDAKEASGDPVAAVHEYEAAVKADPSEQNYFAWGAELLLHRASQPAVQVFSTGALAHPKSSRMLAGLAAAYYSNGQFNEAAAQICRASALNPSEPTPYLFLGKMEQAAADPFSCSEAAFARFAEDQPANAQASFLYGLVIAKQARRTQDAPRFTHAEQLFQKAIGLNPHFAEVYLQLGMLYNAQDKKDAAIAAFQKAVAADASSSAAHYQLSLAYRRTGHAAKADAEMKIYDELHRSEEAALDKERRELRQFVTVLKENPSSQH